MATKPRAENSCIIHVIFPGQWNSRIIPGFPGRLPHWWIHVNTHYLVSCETCIHTGTNLRAWPWRQLARTTANCQLKNIVSLLYRWLFALLYTGSYFNILYIIHISCRNCFKVKLSDWYRCVYISSLLLRHKKRCLLVICNSSRDGTLFSPQWRNFKALKSEFGELVAISFELFWASKHLEFLDNKIK